MKPTYNKLSSCLFWVVTFVLPVSQFRFPICFNRLFSFLLIFPFYSFCFQLRSITWLNYLLEMVSSISLILFCPLLCFLLTLSCLSLCDLLRSLKTILPDVVSCFRVIFWKCVLILVLFSCHLTYFQIFDEHFSLTFKLHYLFSMCECVYMCGCMRHAIIYDDQRTACETWLSPTT